VATFTQGTQAFIDAMEARRPTGQQLRLLMHEAAVKAGEARMAGDEELQAYWTAQREMFARLYTGTGDVADELEFEQSRKTIVQQFLEPVSGMMQSVALAAAVAVAFMLFTRGR
jgi:hypothetical protein